MLPQAFWTSLRILCFRSGPEDFPYDPGHRLSAASIALGLLANSALFLEMSEVAVQTYGLPRMPTMALVIAVGVASVLGMGLFTRLTLQVRQLENRYQQTFNALLVTSSVLSLAMVPLVHVLAPLLAVAQELNEKLAEHPELARDPATLAALPPWSPLLMLFALSLVAWQFAVTAFIYRRAANVQTGGGLLIALLCLLSIASFKALFSAIFG
jgi:hypothetical protein